MIAMCYYVLCMVVPYTTDFDVCNTAFAIIKIAT